MFEHYENYSRYTDGVFNFTVVYPAIWGSECLAYYEATETRNASPDSGIYIYVNGLRPASWLHSERDILSHTDT